MNIKIKILEYFLKAKELGKEKSELVTLDRYLVHAKKESVNKGIKLLEIVNEMVDEGLLSKEDNSNYYTIANKGIEYIN